VPDEALDACADSYHAAKGDSEGHSSEKFDSNGVIAAVCRHDIPVLFINIDTPGDVNSNYDWIFADMMT
jgi:hypothetical protein